MEPCKYCGNKLPVRLFKNGPHVEAVCSCCQKHYAFVKKASIPNFEKTKSKMLKLTNGDTQIIIDIGHEMGIKKSTEIDKDIAFHNLYSRLVKHYYELVRPHMELYDIKFEL